MALIPIQEQSQETIEKQREEEKIVKVQGGFSLEPQTIAIGLVAVIILILFTMPQTAVIDLIFFKTTPGTLIPIMVLALIILIINKSIVNFMEYERGVVFKWGKFNRIAGPGWEVIFPLMERYVKVDMRLEVISLGVQEVVTKDKVRFLVAPEIFMYVSNPKDAILNVQNYKKAVINYVNSALTHNLGDSTSDYIVAHMNEISDVLTHAVQHMAETPGKEWGVVVPRVKLAYIKFPDEVQSAMHKKVASEQLKLASHEKAEAIKTEIDAIREAGGKLTDPALTYMYLESLDKVAKGKATKIILPLEISKMAESITKRTSAFAGPPGSGGINLPPEVIEKYAAAIDNYENRLKQIESKIAAEKDGEPKAIEDKTKVGSPQDKTNKSETKKEDKELSDYKERIKEIKKRVGIE